MNRNARLAVALAAAIAAAGLVWVSQGHDGSIPTAPAPRGAFASDRAAEEPTLPPR